MSPTSPGSSRAATPPAGSPTWFPTSCPRSTPGWRSRWSACSSTSTIRRCPTPRGARGSARRRRRPSRPAASPTTQARTTPAGSTSPRPLDPRASGTERRRRLAAPLHLRLRQPALRHGRGSGMDQRRCGDEAAGEGGRLRAGTLHPDRVRLRLLAAGRRQASGVAGSGASSASSPAPAQQVPVFPRQCR